MNTNSLSPKVTFRHSLRAQVLPREGVLVSSEKGTFFLRGEVYAQLAPFLTGRYTASEIIAQLGSCMSQTTIGQALTHLKRKNYINFTAGDLPVEQLQYWDTLGIDTYRLSCDQTPWSVSVTSLGDIDHTPFLKTLADLNIQESTESDFRVVFTPDYLHEELHGINQETFNRQQPWLIVKPVGTELWLGPLFQPTQTACWACLAQRLRASRKVDYCLAELLPAAMQLSSTAALPSTLQTAFNIAATEVSKYLGQNEVTHLTDRLLCFDTISLAHSRHEIVKRPQCQVCGNPDVVSTQQFTPVSLSPCKKSRLVDGGYRSATPDQLLDDLQHHISPISGLVTFLRSNSPTDSKLTSSFITGHNFTQTPTYQQSELEFLRTSMNGVSGGKGRQAQQAQASALGETLERYSGIFQGDEARLMASAAGLGEQAIHPNACTLYSEKQFNTRSKWNARSSWSTWVPEPFDNERQIEWSPIWSLTHSTFRYLPTATCYYGYARQHDAWFTRADSNGCAAGRTKEEAVLQGFLELVERDAVALWWYNRLQKPGVNLASFSDPYPQELTAYYKSVGRDVWVLDLTSDLGIPVFAAISGRYDKHPEDIIFGFGAHFDPQIAVSRSLTELNQALPAVFSGTPKKGNICVDNDHEMIHWWNTATVEDHPYLCPSPTHSVKNLSDYKIHRSTDLLDDIHSCVEIASTKGLEVLVLDQTRPDVGLHVVKVVVPELRHFWARFAPGRLYDVPVTMGWLPEPHTEEQLNPMYIHI